MPGVWTKLTLAMAALAAGFATSGASAETLRVRGIYPPSVDVPPDVELIVIERFEGDMGQDAEFALARTLGDIRINNAPWFDIISPEALSRAVVEIEAGDGTTLLEPLEADAIFRGIVRSEFYERDLEPKIKTECAKRDKDEKCIEERQVRISCTEQSVRVDPRIVMISADGRQMYSYAWAKTQTESYCADDSTIPSALAMAQDLIEQIVREIRFAVAPSSNGNSPRIMESRSGLNRGDRDAFRAAVRATNDNPRDACEGFVALEATNPQHLSVLFNIGLCWESSGEYERAAEYYQRALAVDGDHDYPEAGLRRVRGFLRGAAYVAQRDAIRDVTDPDR